MQTRDSYAVRPHGFSVYCAFVLALAGCRPSSGEDLSTEQLTAVVVREQASLEPCYQAGLDRTPYEHEFRIEAELRIRPDGSVAQVKLDQTGLQGLGPCIEKTIRGWRFPQARAETRASLPIVFRPKVEKALPENMKMPGFRVLQDDDFKQR